MKTYKIAAIGGDGIGPEVVNAGLEVMETLATSDGTFRFEVEQFDWSSDRYLKHGAYIPEGGLEKLKQFSAILFGAVGSQEGPDHISLSGARPCRSARASTNTPTCGPRACSPA